MSRPLNVVFIVTGLRLGGAETALVRFLQAVDPGALRARVIALAGDGPAGQPLRQLGVPLRTLDLDRPVRGMWRLAGLPRLLNRWNVDIIQTWMYHADLVGTIANRLGPRVPLVWGIRNGSLDPESSRLTTRWIRRICARLSIRHPIAIVSCARTAAVIHERLGYRGDKMVVIPNGIDTRRFRIDPWGRNETRRRLGISPDSPVIGCVARFDPQKDHRTLLAAVALTRRIRPGLRVVLCGPGCAPGKSPLDRWIGELGLAETVIRLGPTDAIESLMCGFDLHSIASSYGEAFPNVVAESMACGVPNVATDVGDAGEIIGDTGLVVAPRDPQALAVAWSRLLDMPGEKRAALGLAARRRIEMRFTMERTVEAYLTLYRKVARIDRLDHAGVED